MTFQPPLSPFARRWTSSQVFWPTSAAKSLPGRSGVEGHAPGVPHAPGPHLGGEAGLADERVVRGHAVGLERLRVARAARRRCAGPCRGATRGPGRGRAGRRPAPPSPMPTYRKPSGPKRMCPPLWFGYGWVIVRRIALAGRVGRRCCSLETRHSETTVSRPRRAPGRAARVVHVEATVVPVASGGRPRPGAPSRRRSGRGGRCPGRAASGAPPSFSMILMRPSCSTTNRRPAPVAGVRDVDRRGEPARDGLERDPVGGGRAGAGAAPRPPGLPTRSGGRRSRQPPRGQERGAPTPRAPRFTS
jgi:hypothetical protein